MRDQRGMALPLTLIIIMILAGVGVGLLSIGGMEPQIAQNSLDSTRARFVAEAGIEWAFNTLADTADWSTLLAGADLVTGVGMAANAAMPSLDASRGTYTVRLRNDARPAGAGYSADSSYTGVALDAGGATSDTNSRVILTSTGQIRGAARTLQVVLERPSFPRPPAALAFPGIEAQTDFDGNSFEVDGRDWTYDAASDTGTITNNCPAAWGISVSATYNSGGNENVVQSTLSNPQKDNVLGKQQDGATAGVGDNAIAPDNTLTTSIIADFVAQAKRTADVVLTSTAASAVSKNSLGDTCATDINSTNCWGTQDYPKVVYIKGDLDPAAAFTALSISGNSRGYGILIVEDGDIKISGNFNWNGIIIASGRYVGVGFMGGGNQSVYGAVISNELATDPFYEGVLLGNAKLRYSCTALDTVRRSRRLVKMNWQEI